MGKLFKKFLDKIAPLPPELDPRYQQYYSSYSNQNNYQALEQKIAALSQQLSELQAGQCSHTGNQVGHKSHLFTMFNQKNGHMQEYDGLKARKSSIIKALVLLCTDFAKISGIESNQGFLTNLLETIETGQLLKWLNDVRKTHNIHKHSIAIPMAR